MTKIEIHVNNVNDAVEMIKKSGNAVNPETKSVPEVSRCDGIMIDKYYDQLQRIGTLMKDYKDLLIRDALDILSSVSEIAEVDTKLGHGVSGRF